MRSKLAATEGERKTFTARVERFGKKPGYTGYSEETILLREVKDDATGEVVTDHLWFTYSKGFEVARVKEGSRIRFDARVKSYAKGYVNHALGAHHKKRDYRLSHPTKITLLQTD